MYRIEPLPPLPATPRPLHTDAVTTPVDVDRRLVLWRVGAPRSSEHYGLHVWLLDSDSALVPFETVEKLVGDETRMITELTLGSFGISQWVRIRTGILEYVFDGEQQAHDLALLAIEGLLVYFADFFTSANRSARLIAFNRIWTIEDFGYAESDFRSV